jgi:hypothetical protein
VGISQDYPLKTRTSKQPIREIPRYEIISSHSLKYPRSKQGLTMLWGWCGQEFHLSWVKFDESKDLVS